ncbi:MAG TPA: hypothetical protein VNC50_17680 [Planctomycetia bacterium]|jgi:hypothetical protein|nr:hypothetical protein [Planctomycetia bacterium]
MSILCPDEVVTLQSRFGNFQDAVLRRIEHSFGIDEGGCCTVTMSVEDHRNEDGYSNVTLVVRGVTELAFRDQAATRQSLPDGLALRRLNGQWWVDFAPFCRETESADEMRLSDFYLTGSSLTWQVAPFSEE